MPIGPNETEILSLPNQKERENINSFIESVCEVIDSKLQCCQDDFERYRMGLISVIDKDILDVKNILNGIKIERENRCRIIEDDIKQIYEKKGWKIKKIECFTKIAPRPGDCSVTRLCDIEFHKKDRVVNKKRYNEDKIHKAMSDLNDELR